MIIFQKDLAFDYQKCPHCNFEADYDTYLEIMKDQAINMSYDYIPKRSGI